MPTLARPGFEVHYDLHPAGAPDGGHVILLHGLGSCAEDWALQIPLLTERHTTLALDLPGHGRSGMPDGWPTMAELARDVAAVLDALGWPPAHIVGLSLGGAVALQLAAAWPQRVRSIVAVNAFARMHRTPASLFNGAARLALIGLGRMDLVGERVARGLFPNPDQDEWRRVAAARIAANDRYDYLRILAAIARFDLRHQLPFIHAPTLVIAGAEDATVPLSAKAEIARRVPEARLQIIPGSRHATPVDAVDRFNALLLGFLEQVDSDSE